jgi:glycosyltransferase involved in cell wall biosynthesis
MSRLASPPEPVIHSFRSADESRRFSGGRRSPHVVFYTAPWAMQHPGGGEVQLLKTAEFLGELGVRVRLFDPWNDRLCQADWLHLFGTLPECLEMARHAKRCGVRVALSPVSWYDPWVNWRLESGLLRKLRAVVGWSVRRAFPQLPSWRRELIQLADVLLPNSQAEAIQLRRLFGADPSRIKVVPNGVDGRFDDGDAELFHSHFGVSDFVLLPGRIEPRKNQLGVIHALWGSGIPLVILGDPHPNYPNYVHECIHAADPGVTFIGRLEHDSPLMAAAYAAARVVVLASWFETPGLAALEGALAGANIVVTERGSAREYFGDAAYYVQPQDLSGIRATVREAFVQPRQSRLRGVVQRQFLWEHVARQSLAAYETLSDESVATARVAEPYQAAA